ncbi:hypothetical protein [Kribbella lupini]|uniref:Uncharacterized protein n=1 Tax=Kribbella lupini TaxID=291602 RepID=A0ABN2AHW2_9ACTN
MWGGKKKAVQDPANGGWQSGRKAKRAPGSGGGIKGKTVVDPKGKVIKNLAGLKRKEGNEHGV